MCLTLRLWSNNNEMATSNDGKRALPNIKVFQKLDCSVESKKPGKARNSVGLVSNI